MTIIQFLVLILIFLLLYFGLNYFVYSQVVSGLFLKSGAKLWLQIFFWLSALSFVLGEFFSRRQVSGLIKPISSYGNIWLGVISISLTVFFIRAVMLFIIRSNGFKYYSAGFSIILILILSLFAIYNVSRNEFIREITIKSAKLPPNISPFAIVQLSDLHINYQKSPERLKRIIEKTNSLSPDLVVITGDMIDADIGKVEEICAILQSLHPKYGTYAITGNHEFYAGLDKFYKAISCAHFQALRNEHKLVAGAIELVGIDDPESRRFLHKKLSLAEAFNTPGPTDHSKFVLFLSHRPEFFDKARSIGIDLQLSGHLHAGQVPPLDLIEYLFFKYPCGLYRKTNGIIYTTPGAGYWGPPMRLFSRSEIVKITIINEKPAK